MGSAKKCRTTNRFFDSSWSHFPSDGWKYPVKEFNRHKKSTITGIAEHAMVGLGRCRIPKKRNAIIESGAMFHNMIINA